MNTWCSEKFTNIQMPLKIYGKNQLRRLYTTALFGQPIGFMASRGNLEYKGKIYYLILFIGFEQITSLYFPIART